MSKDNAKSEAYWLTRPATIGLLKKLFIAALVVLVLADFAVEHHSYFGIDGTFGFGAWVGFVTCMALIAGAKMFGKLLKRPDSYYDH